MSPSRRLATLLVPIALLGARAAQAQNASDKAAAEALFREGRKLYDAGKYPEACAKLAESQRLDPAPGTLLNLAGCYEKNGQTASAWATFKEAVAASHQKGRADWEELAKNRASSLEPTLSHLTITVAAKADGLVIKRDGAAVGEAVWGTPIPVDPGPHVVEATAPHRAPFKATVDVAGSGASATTTVPDLGPEVSTGGGGPEPAKSGSSQRTIGLVVAGAGVVGIGIGSAFGLVAMGKENDATSHYCNASNYCTAQGVQLGQDAQSAATVSTVAFGVGAAALAGGLVLFFLAPKSDEGTPPTVGLRAAPTPGGAAFGLEGSW